MSGKLLGIQFNREDGAPNAQEIDQLVLSNAGNKQTSLAENVYPQNIRIIKQNYHGGVQTDTNGSHPGKVLNYNGVQNVQEKAPESGGLPGWGPPIIKFHSSFICF
jgi:hypothetical protein